MSYQKNAGATRRFARAMKIATWIQNIPNKLTPPPFRLMQISSAYWQSRALYVATRLDIATVLGDQALFASEIADRVSAHPDAVYRLLRMLAAMEIFEEIRPHEFCNNKISHHLRTDRKGNIRDMILMHNSREMSQPWYEQLENGVRNGEVPFQLAHGQALFDYMDTHPEFDALFSRAMDSVEALTGDSFVTDFDWSRFDRVIDIGGSKGSKSFAVLKRHPHIKALVVDRTQVIRNAEQYWSSHKDKDVLTRMTFQAGDLLENIPAASGDRDIYLLSAVLHGFDDTTCIKALKNLANACYGTGACIALMELVVSESNADLTSTTFDMQMFMGTQGRERTLGQWQALFDQSGLKLEEVVHLRSFGKILVASTM